MSDAPILDVLVVGAGPTGQLLAAELTRRGLHVVLLERRLRHEPGTRAIGVHSPVLSALEPSGATERILAGALRVPVGTARSRDRVLGEVRFDRLNTRFPFVATVPQAATEAAVALGGPAPLRGVHAVSVVESHDRVVVATQHAAGQGELHARAVVVAAGSAGRRLVQGLLCGRSREYPDRYLMTDIAVVRDAPTERAVIYLDPAGVLESFPLPDGGRRLVAWDSGARRNDSDSATPLERLQHAVSRRTGDERLAGEVTDASTFGIRHRLLRQLRAGRVIAIGDTAHEISPIGGQGMNLGLLDAVTLAEPLTQWLRDIGACEELNHWERRRLTSARTAARIAHLNTSVGRSRSTASFRASAASVAVVLKSPLAHLAAHAYAMGFDSDATMRQQGRRSREAARRAEAPRASPNENRDDLPEHEAKR